MLKQSLTAKTTALAILAPATLAALLYAATSVSIEADAARQGRDALEQDMRIAHDVLDGYAGSYELRGGDLYRGGVKLNGLTGPVDRIKAMAGSAATLFAGDRRVATNVMQQGRRAVGTRMADGPVKTAVLIRGTPYRGEADVLGSHYLVAYDPIRSAEGAVIGAVFTGMPKSQFYAPVRRVQLGIALVSLLSTLIIGVLAILASRRMFQPLSGLRRVMEELAAGDLAVEVPFRDRRDDVGQMAAAVQGFKDAALTKARLETEAGQHHVQAALRLEQVEAAHEAAGRDQGVVVTNMAAALRALAKGDLTDRITAPFAGPYAQLKSDFNAAVERLQDALVEVADAGRSMHTGAGELSSAANDLSRRTEQQAASLEQTAAALDQITATVKQTAQGASEARLAVATARKDADTSGEVVGRAVETMSQIESSSREIGQIIGLIDEIAFQTNLLALNAGVEAARAGDAGRGFAVVAAEVRALAQRSAEAAKQIKGLVSAADTQVRSGVQLVSETGEALGRIALRVSEVDAAITAICASAQEQAVSLGQVNIAVNQMDQVTQQNAAMVEQSTAATQALAQQADGLAEMLERFELQARPETSSRKIGPTRVAATG